jgi:hypothetical protein
MNVKIILRLAGIYLPPGVADLLPLLPAPRQPRLLHHPHQLHQSKTGFLKGLRIFLFSRSGLNKTVKFPRAPCMCVLSSEHKEY